MGVIAWIVLGLIAGAIAKYIMPGRDPGGIIVTIILGIVGAVVGGFISAAIFGRGGREPGKPAGPGGIPLLHGAERRHPVEDRPRVLRRRQRLHEDLRGQPADAQGPRPDLSRSGPADNELRAVGATLLSVSPGSSSRATAAVLNSAMYRLRVFVVIPVLQVVRKLTTRSGLAGHGYAVLLPNKSVTQRVALNEVQYLLLCPGEN